MHLVVQKKNASSYLKILHESRYLEKSLKFSILTNGLIKPLKHFNKPKSNFFYCNKTQIFYFNKVVGDALRGRLVHIMEFDGIGVHNLFKKEIDHIHFFMFRNYGPRYCRYNDI